jgi:hypothetical protein
MRGRKRREVESSKRKRHGEQALKGLEKAMQGYREE